MEVLKTLILRYIHLKCFSKIYCLLQIIQNILETEIMCAYKHYSHTINIFLCSTIKWTYVFGLKHEDTIIKVMVVEKYVITQ